MREIKFRAWGKYGTNPQKMHYDDGITPFGDSENAMPGEVIRILQENYGWIFMQYTGLKDRNGVEIYEGDILSGEFGKDTVELKEYHIDGGGTAICYVYSYSPLNQGLVDECDIEVIGNIYENPELLERL